MTHDVLDEQAHHIRTPPLEPNVLHAFVEIDVTSLDATGSETSFETSDYVADATVEGVYVLGKENPAYVVNYNRENDDLRVEDASTGGNVQAGTDVGVVGLTVVARDP